MSHTNSTANYNLPQFITTDKPAWLTDVNNAYSAIDLGIKAAKDAGDNAQSDATQALTDAGNAQTTANAANSKAGGAVSSISENFLDSSTYAVGDLVMYNNLLYKCHTAVATPGEWTGSANWSRIDIDTLLSEINGNTLAMPSAPFTTGSIAAAINDLNGNITSATTVDTHFIGVSSYGGSIYARKVNNVCTIYAYGLGSINPPATGSAYTLGTLPERFRPVNVAWFAGTRISGYKYDAIQGYKIDTNGDIITYVYGGAELTNGAFCITYVTI